MSGQIANILVFLIILEIFEVQSVQNNLVRNLNQVVELKFVEAKNLQYVNKQWTFDVKYTDGSLDESSEYYVSILYNQEYNTSLCTVSADSTLTCVVQKDKQSNTIKVQIAGSQASGATIKWSNVNKEIPIPLKLEVKANPSAYDLNFVENKWNFFLKISPATNL